MAYVKAVIGAVVAALLLGAGTGAAVVVKAALARLPPEDRATILAASISEAMNCAAFFFLVLVPLAVLIVFAVIMYLAKRSVWAGLHRRDTSHAA